ncbi:type 2 lanthipeptide synthetase LanM family protein [Streptomyces sp. ME19-01-6]|uniref:type 2 lanthipeptide synthetase LanM family protein n=1 Tax=Streptomyces sp. ME19-01-6 TaxID=3028686 RepID=UPI0029AA5C35|nr:type 2 lanthipeptide synthetase LanM family protein [Streptomyces sp. ME19-01-6]MDX3226545.1 type 2 lanthipeptide synthetase LanM family protein [Streptomyces sp. ME19-01-6]
MSFSELPWHNAAYLHERPPSPVKGDPSRWSDTLGPGEALASAVHALGLTHDDFLNRLGPQCRQDWPTPTPDWVRAVDRRAALGEAEADSSSRVYPYLVRADEMALIRPVAALVRGSQRELGARAAESTAGSRLATLPGLLARAWPSEDIARITGRTMVRELNVARIEGRLRGDTPRERYADYLRLLGDPATRRALWAEYPVLLRHIGDLLTGWVDSRAELAERLVADLAELDTWCDGGLGEVTDVRFRAGGTHRRGRGVAIVSFTGATVVYKPRPLDADLAWGEVLGWFHRQAPPHDLIAQATLARDGYGWSGFVEALPCRTPEEVRHFSWRTGALLALHHVLCGVDVHHENLVAHGAYPVVIDMEALFHGALPAPATRLLTAPADGLMAEGVLSVGLLPSKLVVRDQGNAREDTAGRPRLDGEPADPREHAADLEAGFAWTYRAIGNDRAGWAALLDRFADVELRHVPRAIAYYSSLLEDSRHPDFLRDALDRDRLLARLALGADGGRPWERLVPSELRDLRRGDVPFFSSTPGSRDLVDGDGVRIPGFLEEAPIEVARRRLAEFGEEDLAVQTTLIRRAFEALRPATATRQRAVRLPLPDRAPAPDDVLEEALRLAHGLCDTAIRRQDRLGWIGLNFLDDSSRQVGPPTPDLYTGMPGVGLFLSVAAALSDDPRLGEYAELTAASLAGQALAVAHRLASMPQALLREALEQHADAGAFGVTGSLIYYLAHVGARHRRADVLDAAEHSLETLSKHIALDSTYDVIGGSAGAILSALALHAARPGSAALQVAERAAARLLQAAAPMGDGLGWPTRPGPRPPTGISRGAGGIAYALARLHAVRPRPEYARTIAGALRYERSALDTAVGNWPGHRAEEHGGSGGHLPAWCHGAPGIGMSRLGILRASAMSEAGTADTAADTAELAEEDLRIAERTTRAHLFGPDGDALFSMGNNGLCHGDLGNLEFLQLAAQRRGDEAGTASVRRAVGALLRLGREGWLTGQLSPDSLPGLMYGRAGIGYNLLRLTFPDQVPSVLLLEGP